MTINDDEDDYEHENDTEVDIDEEMRKFQEELKTVAKSIDEDDDFAQLLERAEKSLTPSAKSPLVKTTPYKSPLPKSAAQVPGQKTPLEPVPVSTPAPFLFSPSEPAEDLKSRLDKEVSLLDQQDFDEQDDPNNFGTATRDDLQRTLELMQQTIQRQEERIGYLELENRELREELRYARQSSTGTPRTGRSRSSPGARFAAEFSDLIGLDATHRERLSHIMDDHFRRTRSSQRHRDHTPDYNYF